MNRDARIEALLDKQAITELSYRYSRACDRLDRELLESVYWPDGTDDHGAFVGSAPDYVDWVMGLLSGWTAVHHDNTNILIDLDGDTATGEVHWTGYYSYPVGGVSHDHLAVGRYIDRYERRGGEWRIKHRTCLSDWSRIEPGADWRTDPARSRLAGKRKPHDLLYQARTLGAAD
ncbi:nuclear transport factor 2 family protein [Iodidimonas sp. SYSU 1G8]|uniref:nuclear transport factor 2 family protein n=1 Tax=Iodidimonas sp. SYSU 1G8 TaxID=3133967 RepID=UPI0031FF1756